MSVSRRQDARPRAKFATRTRRSAAACAAAACIVATLFALPLASSALAGTTSSSQEEFRASLGTYLQNLQGALTTASRNPQTRSVVAPHLSDVKGLAAAKRNLSKLNGQQLEAMRAILGRNPSWAEQPNVLRQALLESSTAQTTSAAASTSIPEGYLSDCSDEANLGDAKGLFYSYWAAAQVASAAYAVASAIPDDIAYTPGLIAAGIVYGTTNGLAIGLNDRLARKLDCSTAASNATLISAYPIQSDLDPSPGAYTRASSQASVNRLTAAAAGIDETLNTIETVINTTTANLALVINRLGLALGNTAAIQTTSMDLQARSGDLLSSIGTPTDQASYSGSDPSGTANGLANTIDNRADTALANTASLQTLSVRIGIERSLTTESNPSIALFALPASQGGYLETVRDIVTSTLVNEVAAGQQINGNADEDLARGNDALAAGQYERAYQLYAEAYRHAVG